MIAGLRRIFPMCPITAGMPSVDHRRDIWLCWHSPHSLTWSWIAAIGWNSTRKWEWNPSATCKRAPLAIVGARLGSFLGGYAYRSNGGLQCGVSMLWLRLSWSRQRPMWFRDLYRDEQRRHDEERNQARLLRQFGGRS